MRGFKSLLVMFIICAGCTSRLEAEPSRAPSSLATVRKAAPSAPQKKTDKELKKILHWFEQMDAIFREALWVIRQERAPQGKSIFGKMQRALLIEMQQKLSNKSLFKCDVYSMTRNLPSLGGVPQSAEVMHQCNKKESFIKIGDWTHPKSNELIINFRGGNLAEVLGFATSILSPRMSCQLKSNASDIIESFNCEGLMIDFNPAKNQVLRFNRFEYRRSAKTMLHLKAEVLENLDPVRKIEVDVPLEGKISVVETVLQVPEYLAKPIPATPPPRAVLPKPPVPQQNPVPGASPAMPSDVSNEQDVNHDKNGRNQESVPGQLQESDAHGFPPQVPLPAPQLIPAEEGLQEGVIESGEQKFPQPKAPEPENNILQPGEITH